ncbi:hypothetical protein D3C78_1350910 [compost metagenome]
MTEIGNIADDFTEKRAEVDRLGAVLADLFAHQQDGAVGNGVQFFEIRQPFGPFFVVLDEFRPEAHAGHRGSKIVASCSDEAHAALHRRLQAAGEFVQRPRGCADFAGSGFRQVRQRTVRPDAGGGIFQHVERAGDLAGRKDRNRGATKNDQPNPHAENLPAARRRTHMWNFRDQPSAFFDRDRRHGGRISR